MQSYKRFTEEMILRDHLALDRTILANERTLLAYLRTCIGLLASGVGLIQLIRLPYSTVVGCALVALSPFCAVFGVMRYIRIRRKLKTLDTKIQ